MPTVAEDAALRPPTTPHPVCPYCNQDAPTPPLRVPPGGTRGAGVPGHETIVVDSPCLTHWSHGTSTLQHVIPTHYISCCLFLWRVLLPDALPRRVQTKLLRRLPHSLRRPTTLYLYHQSFSLYSPHSLQPILPQYMCQFSLLLTSPFSGGPSSLPSHPPFLCPP